MGLFDCWWDVKLWCDRKLRAYIPKEGMRSYKTLWMFCEKQHCLGHGVRFKVEARAWAVRQKWSSQSGGVYTVLSLDGDTCHQHVSVNNTFTFMDCSNTKTLIGWHQVCFASFDLQMGLRSLRGPTSTPLDSDKRVTSVHQVWVRSHSNFESRGCNMTRTGSCYNRVKASSQFN